MGFSGEDSCTQHCNRSFQNKMKGILNVGNFFPLFLFYQIQVYVMQTNTKILNTIHKFYLSATCFGLYSAIITQKLQVPIKNYTSLYFLIRTSD